MSLLHESLFRTPPVMKRLSAAHVTVCGAGALGSHLVDGLARAGVGHLRVVDVHAGMAGDYAEVVWDPAYRVPSATNDDVCDYPLARNLAIITSALAAEVVIRFIADGARTDVAFTFDDLKITTSA